MNLVRCVYMCVYFYQILNLQISKLISKLGRWRTLIIRIIISIKPKKFVVMHVSVDDTSNNFLDFSFYFIWVDIFSGASFDCEIFVFHTNDTIIIMTNWPKQFTGASERKYLNARRTSTSTSTAPTSKR